MNESSASFSHPDPRASVINGRTVHLEFAHQEVNVGARGMFQVDTPELSDQLRVPSRWSHEQEPSAQTGRNKGYVTVLSHELRNSLGAIRSAVHILRLDTSTGSAGVKARMVIERQVAQMTRLVEDLLDASRVRGGQMELQCERVDLCAVAARAAQTVEFTMQQRHHHMTTSLPNAPVWLQADAARLEQVFVNLLFNAAKYTDLGGDIGLSAEREGGEAVVRIRDTGIGIEPNVLPYVFDLFVQADPSSRRADGGLGIGLALVRSLIERHGGRVTATSAGLGHGSEFTVRLPIPSE